MTDTEFQALKIRAKSAMAAAREAAIAYQTAVTADARLEHMGDFLAHLTDLVETLAARHG